MSIPYPVRRTLCAVTLCGVTLSPSARMVSAACPVNAGCPRFYTRTHGTGVCFQMFRPKLSFMRQRRQRRQSRGHAHGCKQMSTRSGSDTSCLAWMSHVRFQPIGNEAVQHVCKWDRPTGGTRTCAHGAKGHTYIYNICPG